MLEKEWIVSAWEFERVTDNGVTGIMMYLGLGLNWLKGIEFPVGIVYTYWYVLVSIWELPSASSF